MFCHKCGKRLAEGGEFCHKCGAKVVVVNPVRQAPPPAEQPYIEAISTDDVKPNAVPMDAKQKNSYHTKTDTQTPDICCSRCGEIFSGTKSVCPTCFAPVAQPSQTKKQKPARKQKEEPINEKFLKLPAYQKALLLLGALAAFGLVILMLVKVTWITIFLIALAGGSILYALHGSKGNLVYQKLANGFLSVAGLIAVMFVISWFIGDDSPGAVTPQQSGQTTYTLGDTFVYDNIEITLGSSLIRIKYDSEPLFAIPVTIKNLSNGTLDPFWSWMSVTQFGSKGIKSKLSWYDDFRRFDDDIRNTGEMRSGVTQTGYFYYLYDGDGEYLMEFGTTALGTVKPITVVFTVTADGNKY